MGRPSAFDLWCSIQKPMMHPFLRSVPPWLMLLLSITQTNSDWNTFCRRARTNKKNLKTKKTSQVWTASKTSQNLQCTRTFHFEPSNLPLRLAPPFQLVGSLGRCAHPRDFQLLCLENRENPPHFLGKFVTSKRRRSPKAWINGRFHSGNSITLQNGY